MHKTKGCPGRRKCYLFATEERLGWWSMVPTKLILEQTRQLRWLLRKLFICCLRTLPHALCFSDKLMSGRHFCTPEIPRLQRLPASYYRNVRVFVRQAKQVSRIRAWLCGLRLSPRASYGTLHVYLLKTGFVPSPADTCWYILDAGKC